MTTASSSITPSKNPEMPAVIYRILRAYGVSFRTVGSPQKGYRNQSFRIGLPDGGAYNLLLYKTEAGIVRTIKSANAVGNFLAAAGFPARHSVDARILRLQYADRQKFAALYNYLEGATIPWEGYTQDHIKALGGTMGDMHAALAGFDASELADVTGQYLTIVSRMKGYFAQGPVQRALADKLLLGVDPTIFIELEQLLIAMKALPGKHALHMDFVRSNILFADASKGSDLRVSISGILDFEKTAYGHPLFDVARTLAFLLVDCKYKQPDKVRKYFLGSGYIKRGAARLPASRLGMLEPLLGLFLFYDFYKFLRHNPYESLPDNEHFMRTVSLLIPRRLVVPTTSVARLPQ